MSFSNFSQSHQVVQSNRWYQYGKEKAKLLLFVDSGILYIREPKDSTTRLLELIKELNKVARTKSRPTSH